MKLLILLPDLLLDPAQLPFPTLLQQGVSQSQNLSQARSSLSPEKPQGQVPVCWALCQPAGVCLNPRQHKSTTEKALMCLHLICDHVKLHVLIY